MKQKIFNQIAGLDKKQHVSITLEQYRIYVNSIESVSNRRANVNSYFLTLTTAIGGAIGYTFTMESEFNELITLIVCLSGALICIYWYFILGNYKKLNSGKFKVLSEIEKTLPVNLFEYEWEILGRGKNPSLYRRTSKLERSIPIVLLIAYLSIIILSLVELMK